MRPRTTRQAHVLANLERVLRWPRLLLPGAGHQPRYQLDGEACTQQINGLLARKDIRHIPGDGFVRTVP